MRICIPMVKMYDDKPETAAKQHDLILIAHTLDHVILKTPITRITIDLEVTAK